MAVGPRFESRIPAISRKLTPEMDIATLEAAEQIKEIAKQLCPVDVGRVHLRDAIHVERSRDRDGRLLTWVVAWSREAWYGFLVEYGTVHTGHPELRKHMRGEGRKALKEGRALWVVPPHPFLTPAAEAGREIARKRADQAIKDAAEAQ